MQKVIDRQIKSFELAHKQENLARQAKAKLLKEKAQGEKMTKTTSFAPKSDTARPAVQTLAGKARKKEAPTRRVKTSS